MERRTRQAGVCGGSGNKGEALRGSYYSTDRGQRRHFYLLLRILVGILIFTWDSMNTWYLYYPPPPTVSCVPLVLTEQGWQLWETGASISCSSGILSASCTEKRGGCTLLPPLSLASPNLFPEVRPTFSVIECIHSHACS